MANLRNNDEAVYEARKQQAELTDERDRLRKDVDKLDRELKAGLD